MIKKTKSILRSKRAVFFLLFMLALVVSCTKDEEEVQEDSLFSFSDVTVQVTGAAFTVLSEESGRLHYGALTEGETPPTDLAGVQALPGADSVDVTAGTAISITLDNLDPATTYTIYSMLAEPDNAGMPLSPVVAGKSFSTEEPVFVFGEAFTNIVFDSATFTLTSGQAGRLHYGALAEGETPPTNLGGIQSLVGADSVDITLDSEITITIGGLRHETSYRIYAILAELDNAGTLLSSIQESRSFTTPESPLTFIGEFTEITFAGARFTVKNTIPGLIYYSALGEGENAPETLTDIQNVAQVSKSVPARTPGENSLAFFRLTSGTTYRVYMVLVDLDNSERLLSPIVSSETFATQDAQGVDLSVMPERHDFGIRPPHRVGWVTKQFTIANSGATAINATINSDNHHIFRLSSLAGLIQRITVPPNAGNRFSVEFRPPSDQPNMSFSARIKVSVPGLSNITIPVMGRTSELPERVYVDKDATGAGDGSSWANAYRNLKKPLDSLRRWQKQTEEPEIWVAEGTYQAPENGFFIRFPVRIYGGFTGTETSLDQRNWNENRTILTGGGTSTHVVRIHTPPNRNDPSDFTVRDIRIDGFDVTEGAALDYSFSNFTQHGAALAIGDLSQRTTHRWIRVKVVNTRIHGNRAAGSGSAIRNSHGPASFINTLIYDNEAGVDANNRFVGGSRGAIIWSDPVQGSDRKVRFINCVIAHNRFGPHNNSSAGIRLNGPNNEIINSIIWSDMSSDFPEQVAGDAGTVVRNNLMKTGTPDNGNIIGMDPMFINSDVSAFDPCLRAGSPAIDAGDNGRVPDDVSTDIKGASRIQRTVDIGACEQ